jgi:hypothetical protein
MINNKQDFKNARDKFQNDVDGINNEQRITKGELEADKIAMLFADMKEVSFNRMENSPSDNIILPSDKVQCNYDYMFGGDVGRMEIKQSKTMIDIICWKNYQLQNYASKKAKILFVNGWFTNSPEYTIINPIWILKNGKKGCPQEAINKLSEGHKNILNKKFDKSTETYLFEWKSFPYRGNYFLSLAQKTLKRGI